MKLVKLRLWLVKKIWRTDIEQLLRREFIKEQLLAGNTVTLSYKVDGIPTDMPLGSMH